MIIWTYFIYLLFAWMFSYLLIKLFSAYCVKHRFVAADRHKDNKKVPVSGGLPVLVAVIITVLLFLYMKLRTDLLLILISLSLVTIIGLLDDLSKKTNGLGGWQKPILSFLAVIPILIYPVVTRMIEVPIIGKIWFSSAVIYYLVLVMIFVGASNMVNLLAGFNGLESGLALVYTSFLGLYAVYIQNIQISILSFAMFGALLPFYYFNKYPARIFPGDALTYLLGAYLGIVATIGGMPKQAFIVSIPFFIEGVLKLRSRFQAQSFCKLNKEGKLVHTGKIYSIPHFVAKYFDVTERQLVYLLMGFEVFVCYFILVF